ncbi:MAG: hypothetical protein IMF11_20360, partial [Proteobacteria bacterium]|nr:hypothetical protein [Pseudomonadota bacterium]
HKTKISCIHDIQLGLIFAGAMFNSQFAIYIDDAFKQYVIHVDDNYYQKKHLVNEDSKEARSFRKWFVTFQKTRLTTYDTRGNIMTGGGIPHGLDVVAFDFYLSTLLFDHMYDRVLDWFAKNRGNAARDFFKGKCISDVRKILSFFKDGPVTVDKLNLKRDREILNRAFDCRIETTVDLLRQEINNSGQNNLKIMLIGESSTNGLFEFNDRGIIEQDQPQLLVELRMLDEVKRALQYYTENIDGFKGGLAFFLYPNAYDKSINLFISGVKGAPSVLNYIYKQRNLIMKKPDRSQRLIKDIKKKTVGYYAGFLDNITISKITGLSIEEIEAVTKRTSR